MFWQNDQIHNNLYLVVWNCNEVGKVYQVTEKWVFFKLLFQILQTDSSGGKNHKSYLLQNKFNTKMTNIIGECKKGKKEENANLYEEAVNDQVSHNVCFILLLSLWVH